MSLIAAIPRPLSTRTPRGAASVVWIAALVVAGAMTIPLIYLVVRAAGADSDAWHDLLRGPTWRLLRNTVLLAVSVTGASILISLPIAWLVVRTDLPLRRAWAVLAVLPLVFPVVRRRARLPCRDGAAGHAAALPGAAGRGQRAADHRLRGRIPRADAVQPTPTCC